MTATDSDRVVRIFVSSTFHDFERERDLLTRQVMPELRARAAGRDIELVAIDLRWGITEAQAERGETLPICLAEIERCRPYFVGLLGDRAGWTPPANAYDARLLEMQPWLQQLVGGASVTELEILHGVLRAPQTARHAVFCLRDAEWSRRNGFGARDPIELDRVERLRARVRASGMPVHECRDPEAIARCLLEHLWRAIDTDFPQHSAPSGAELERRAHVSFAAARRRLFVGRETLLRDIDRIEATEDAGCVLLAESGQGKSALLATFARRLGAVGAEVFEHYVAASGQASSSHALLSRLHTWVSTQAGSISDMPSDADPRSVSELTEALPARLEQLSHLVTARGTYALLVIDALNELRSDLHLPWLPARTFPSVRWILSTTLPSQASLAQRSGVRTLKVEAMLTDERALMLDALLHQHRKRLPDALRDDLLQHPLAASPIFLRTVASELCVSATHETLATRVRQACNATAVGEVLGAILRRIELDLHDAPVARSLTLIRCSRDGLSEQELQQACAMPPADWARIRLACEDLLYEAGGRFHLQHDHVRQACDECWLPEPAALRNCHRELAAWWRSCGPSARGAFELPWQLSQGEYLQDLRDTLLDPHWLAALLATRPDQETLSWMNLVGLGEPQLLEHAISERWESWISGVPDADRADLASSVGSFLGFATNGCSLAVRLLQESVDGLRRAGGAGESLALRLNNLGHEALRAGEVNRAVGIFQECLHIRERVLSPEHPNFMGTLDNLGQSLSEAGETREALQYFRRALDLRRKGLGLAHPDTATSMNNLAMTLLQNGESEEAGRLLEDAYLHTRNRLGPDDPETGISAGNLGNWHASHGDASKAAGLLQEAVELHRRALGATHPHVQTGEDALRDLPLVLALRLRREGDSLHARDAIEIELARRAQRFGDDSLEVATALFALAETLEMLGDLPAARLRLERCLAIRSQILGETASATDRCRMRLEGLNA
jgi:nephrocystin-3